VILLSTAKQIQTSKNPSIETIYMNVIVVGNWSDFFFMFLYEQWDDSILKPTVGHGCLLTFLYDQFTNWNFDIFQNNNYNITVNSNEITIGSSTAQLWSQLETMQHLIWQSNRMLRISWVHNHKNLHRLSDQ